MRRFAAIVLALLPYGVAAQHPNDERGFSPERMFNVHDLDSVNSYNGNLVVRIPVGSEYKGNGNLSYQLNLVYNSHCWSYFVNNTSDPPQIVAHPIKSFNAGMGWKLSLGRLFEGGDPDNESTMNHWTYQAGDGSDHSFYDALHSSTISTAPVQYTRDATFIRMTQVNQTIRRIEFPDGSVHAFLQLQPTTDGQPWPTSTTSHRWFLAAMYDSFGNSVGISYSGDATYKEKWIISNDARTVTIYFRPDPYNNFDAVLDHVDMQVVNGAVATYLFTTETLNMPPGNGDNTHPPGTTLPVQVLTAITPPVGNAYGIKIGSQPQYSITPLTSGVLTRLILPTLGAIGWSYDLADFGTPDSKRSPAIDYPVAVASRVKYDSSGTPQGTWSYGRVPSNAPSCTSTCPGPPPYTCFSGRPRQITTWVTAPSVGPTVATTINYFSHFERVSDPNGDSCTASPEGWLNAEHGLPFTRYASRDGRFLSSEIRSGFSPAFGAWDGKGAVPASGTRLRVVYSAYQMDPDGATDLSRFDHNASLSSTATYFYDDPACGAEPPCYLATKYLAPDSYGHYKLMTTTGNVPSGSNFRSEFTNYNAIVTADKWLLNTSTEQCFADVYMASDITTCASLPGAVTTKTSYDQITGALNARRTLKQAPSGGTIPLDVADVLVTFAYQYGNLLTESYYGGDKQALSLTDPFTPPGSPAYSISHLLEYTNGALTHDKATYGSGVTVSDQNLDRYTRLVTSTRDVAGVQTSYSYDLLGRLIQMVPTGMVMTTYDYFDATASSPFKVIAKTISSDATLGRIEKQYHYDSWGQLWREKTLTLGNSDTFTIAQTDRDVLGRKISVSMPEILVVPEENFVPAHKTQYEGYDAFDRPSTIRPPDNQPTTYSYTGSRIITKTSLIATIMDQPPTPQATTEIYDARGRLQQVIEPTNNSFTSYTYDAAGHLQSVNMSASGGTQQRTFTYDNRGFLTEERHPEHERIRYGDYDARGHPEVSPNFGPVIMSLSPGYSHW